MSVLLAHSVSVTVRSCGFFETCFVSKAASSISLIRNHEPVTTTAWARAVAIPDN